jgi:chlorophyll synthase
VQLGVGPAALLACVMMAIPQVLAVAVLVDNGRGTAASVVTALLAVQVLFLMPYFLREPRKRAPLYNATGTSCYVAGMLVSAFAMRALAASGH